MIILGGGPSPACACLCSIGESRTGHKTPNVSLLCWAEAKNLLQSAGNTFPNAAQDVVDFPCHKSTLLAHGQLLVQQDPCVRFCNSASQPVSPQQVLVCGRRCGTLGFPLLNLVRFLSSRCSSLSRSDWQLHHLLYQPFLHVSYHLQTCWEYSQSCHPG